MSVPPQLIRVKRKATEEAPVSYLRVQETKRHRSDIFIYQRQSEEVTVTETIPRQIQTPVIHTSSASRQSTAYPDKDVPADKGNDNDDAPKVASSRATPTNPASTNTLDSAPSSEPRRFHMSRKDMLLAASPYPDRSHGGISKKRPATAMFVEREIKRISSRVVNKLHAANDVPDTMRTPANCPAIEAMEIDKPELKKFKKPGVAKLTAARDNKPTDKPQLPKSMTDRWNVDMQQLTADMEAYAMQQIGINLQRAEEERREQERPRIKTSSQLKFKPKPPAKRYAERHPEEVQPSMDKEMIDADVETSDSDDGDYIIETYIRVPASSMGDHVPPQSVGLLVFDAEPDVEFFYGEDDESEDEWAEDEEDENAENYYTADYPDEEVATDDEFDTNPYAFRTGNASDLEEYDIGVESDDQFDEGAAGQFRTYIGRNGARSNHL